MADFPSNPTLPVMGIGQVMDIVNPGVPASANWGAANQANYWPIKIRDPFLLASMYILFGSITGTKNWDIGLYDRAGTRLWSNGSFAGTTDAFVVKTVGTPFWLSPGTYYMALASSSATANGIIRRGLARAGINNLLGAAQQATAFALPATATFATNSVTYVPVMGIAQITSY